MQERINERVDVITVFQTDDGQTRPYRLRWRGRSYTLTQLGYHHTLREGRTLIHIFAVSTDTLSFKLRFNTDTLQWLLEEVYSESGL